MLFQSGLVLSYSDDGPSDGPKIIAEPRKSPKHPKKVTLVVPDNHHPLVDAELPPGHWRGLRQIDVRR